MNPYSTPKTLSQPREIRCKKAPRKYAPFVWIYSLLVICGSAYMLASSDHGEYFDRAPIRAVYDILFLVGQSVCAIGMILNRRRGFIGYVVLVFLNIGIHLAMFHKFNLISLGVLVVSSFVLLRAMPGAVNRNAGPPS